MMGSLPIGSVSVTRRNQTRNVQGVRRRSTRENGHITSRVGVAGGTTGCGPVRVGSRPALLTNGGVSSVG